jgi:hypothetical protein
MPIEGLSNNLATIRQQWIEIFSAENRWKQPGEEVTATCVERFGSVY